MHLKKLIISGFKSFADRVTLNFDKGITGIVGPNGSGKSNVIDAVRWVMGEQNAKHLRGKVATDIIFAGSDKRKPLGMAEVTLVFDNTEADEFSPPEYRHDAEISLTRRLYIDGQREYFINKKVCRLKDIVNFFAVTGLGGRSYSMIQQGQVDRILNARPEDVREILEEAAGTLVYRKRKDEANKRLAETNENLSRVDDILEELSNQLDGLKDQVTKATKYKELSSSLREQEISLFCHNFKHFTSKLLLLNDNLETGNEQEVGQIKALTDLEVRHAKLQQQLADADPGLEHLREQLASIREQIVRTETVISSSDVTIEGYQERIDAIADELDKQSESHGGVGEKLADITIKLEELQANLTEGQERLEQLEFDSSQADEKAQVFINRMDELDEALRNTDRLMENNGVRCENIERERQRYLKEIALLDQKREEYEQQAAEAKRHLDKEEEALADHKSGVDGEVTAKADLEDRLAAIAADNDALRSDKDAINKDLYGARAKQETLSEIADSTDGAQQVLEHLANVAQQGGARVDAEYLQDHLAFSSGFDIPAPVKTLLDTWSNRLVVNDRQQFETLAEACQGAGLPETFVDVLSEINSADQSAWQSFAQQHNLIPLSQLVDVAESRLAPVLAPIYYDANAYLADAQLPAGLAVISSRGFFRHSSSRVIGGSKGSLSRKEELSALADAIERHEERLTDIDGRLEELAEARTVASGELADINAKLAQSNEDVIARMADIQKWTQTHSHVASLIDNTKVDHARIDVSYNKLVEELKQLSSNRLALGNEKTTLQEEREQLSDESFEITEEREELRRQLDAKKLELAAVEAQVTAVTDNRDNLESQLVERDNALKAKQHEQIMLNEKLVEAREQQQEATESIAEYIYNREQLEQELNAKREENAGIIGELKEVEEELKTMRSAHAKFQQDRTQKSMEVEQLKAVSKGILEQAMEDYQIDLMNYPFEEDPDFNEKTAHTEVKGLKRKIEGLGAVNMMAVEEFEKLTERFEMVTGQKDEVLGSMDILANAVAEIELSAKDKFLKTFEQINQYFTELFPILFPGGEARLECQDLENPLESGVEIMVRMPGKTAKSMTLYSGGEKALTAISLIFALLKTKPTPFCFLDEVDAPLDEANVSKYNNVLDVLSQRFQFVVITHNRKTMEVLDQLYGVTMQEAGVSKVVGVDLNRDLPTHLQKSFAEDRDRIIQGAAQS